MSTRVPNLTQFGVRWSINACSAAYHQVSTAFISFAFDGIIFLIAPVLPLSIPDFWSRCTDNFKMQQGKDVYSCLSVVSVAILEFFLFQVYEK